MLISEDNDPVTNEISKKFENDFFELKNEFEARKNSIKADMDEIANEVKNIDDELEKMQKQIDNKAEELHITVLSNIVGDLLRENKKLFSNLKKLEESKKEAKEIFLTKRKGCWKELDKTQCRNEVNKSLVDYQKVKKSSWTVSTK